MSDESYEQEGKIFDRLYKRTSACLSEYGKDDWPSDHGDFWVLSDYWGCRPVRVSAQQLTMLRPQIIQRLRTIIKKFPGWEIVVVVTLREHQDDWPNMGLYIRPHEIIDGLQRQFFPEEFRDFAYEGSRRGGKRD